MKKIYLLFFLAACCSLQASAVIRNVMVQNFQFSPASMAVNVGDTIKWTWVNGVHTTTSTAVPAGATEWDKPMTQSAQTFLYKVTVAGTYNYVCIPHSPNMAGSFTATGVSAVPGVADADPAFTIRGNVVSEELKIDFNLATSARVSIRLYNLVGRLVRTYSDSHRASGTSEEMYLVGDLPKGLYLLAVEIGGRQVTRRVIIE